uniref:GSK3B-interacting protein isoform X1 n=1 Tax=Myodes glareolus TaxID=447135 RepID=UPI0020209A15|nr:GSK3B-interacting protein isoform X1 [Myodes glareolus]
MNGRGDCGGGDGADAASPAPDASGRGRGGTWALAERLSWYAAPTTGNLEFGAFVGNTVFSVKIRRLATPGEPHRRLLCSRGDLRSRIFTFYETVVQRGIAGSFMKLPLKAGKSAVLGYIPDTPLSHLEPVLPSLSSRCRLSQLWTD